MSNFFNLEEEPEFLGNRNDGRGYQNVFSAPALPSISHRGLEGSPILSSAGTSSNASSSSDNEGDELNLVAGNARKLPLHGIKKPDSNNDCLFGRGGGTNTHPGNKKFRNMIKSKQVVYGTLSKSEKTKAAKQIVLDWRSGGGRFLKLNDETRLWDDVGDDEAKVKVAQALREKRNSKVKTQALVQQNISSVCDSLPLPNQNSLAANSHVPDVPPPMPPLLAVTAAVEATTSSSLVATVATGSIIHGSNLMMQALITQPLSSMQTDYLGILLDCLRAIGVSGVSSLKGHLAEEFVTIKKAYFEAMLRASQHPGNTDTAVRFSRTAFVLLKGMFHKLQAQQSTFVRFFAAAKGEGGGSNLQFIEDLYTIAWQSTASCPPEQHLLMAASAKTPPVCVEISANSSRQCDKCSRSCAGELTVGLFGKWQHLTCWNQVPVEIWLGLTHHTNAMVGRNDVMANMDEIFLKGFSNLDFVSQLEFARHVMKREHWVMAGLGMNTGLSTQPSLVRPPSYELSSTSSGENFFAFPPLGVGIDKKRASDTTDSKAGDVNSRELARPLKKRAVGSVDVLPQPQHEGGALLNSNSVLNSHDV